MLVAALFVVPVQVMCTVFGSASSTFKKFSSSR